MNSNGPYSAQGLTMSGWPIGQSSPVVQAARDRRGGTRNGNEVGRGGEESTGGARPSRRARWVAVILTEVAQH
jgi:hypothetical protein